MLNNYLNSQIEIEIKIKIENVTPKKVKQNNSAGNNFLSENLVK